MGRVVAFRVGFGVDLWICLGGRWLVTLGRGEALRLGFAAPDVAALEGVLLAGAALLDGTSACPLLRWAEELLSSELSVDVPVADPIAPTITTTMMTVQILWARAHLANPRTFPPRVVIGCRRRGRSV